MNFIDSIRFPLKVWHAFGISTFQIGSIPSVQLSLFRKIYTIFVGISYLYRLFDYQPIYTLKRESFAQLLFELVQRCCSILLPATGLAILIESMLKQNQQQKFLADFIEIDKQFEQLLSINLQYSDQKRRHIQRFIRWMTINLVMELVYPVVFLVKGAQFMYLVTPFIRVFCSLNMALRVYQYTTFVDMINWRYSLVNKYINDVYSLDLDKLPVLLVKPGQESEVNCQQIDSLRQICRSLNTASRHVNELFSVSLSLCILLAFSGFFFTFYNTLKLIFVLENILFGSIVACGIVSSTNNLISMAVVCGKTSEEVKSIFFKF